MKTTKKVRDTIHVKRDQVSYSDEQWERLCNDIDAIARQTQIQKARLIFDLLEDGIKMAYATLNGEKK